MKDNESFPDHLGLVDQSKTQRFTISVLSFILAFSLGLNTFYFFRLNARADAASKHATQELVLAQKQEATITNLQSQLQDARTFNQLLGSLIIESSQNPQVPLTPAQQQTLSKLRQLVNKEAIQSSTVLPSTSMSSAPHTTAPRPTPRPRPPPHPSTTTTSTTSTTSTTLVVCIKTTLIHVGC